MTGSEVQGDKLHEQHSSKSYSDPYQASRILQPAILHVGLQLVIYILLSWQRGQG